MFKFLEFRKVGALFLATLMLAVSCSQYEMKNELKGEVSNQNNTEVILDNTYAELLKAEQQIAFNYIHNNVKVCGLKTEQDITGVINEYAKYRGVENYSICEDNIEILSKYFTKEIDELGILNELVAKGHIDKTTYNLFVEFDKKLKTIENEKDYDKVIIWFTNEIELSNLATLQKENILKNISILENTADILETAGDKNPCSDCMKKKAWYLIGLVGATIVLSAIVCVNAPLSIPVCVMLVNGIVLWLICDKFCPTPCRPNCELLGW